jgi:hypothetical protein
MGHGTSVTNVDQRSLTGNSCSTGKTTCQNEYGHDSIVSTSKDSSWDQEISLGNNCKTGASCNNIGYAVVQTEKAQDSSVDSSISSANNCENDGQCENNNITSKNIEKKSTLGIVIFCDQLLVP